MFIYFQDGRVALVPSQSRDDAMAQIADSLGLDMGDLDEDALFAVPNGPGIYWFTPPKDETQEPDWLDMGPDSIIPPDGTVPS
jgi:hypothetical protein